MLNVHFLLFALVSLLAKGIYAGYKTVKHPHNSSSAIRVKEHADSVLCKSSRKHFTGWVDMRERHLFYWYHPARHVPAKEAPLLIWLDGEPGASSMIGMLMLHGPCLLDPQTNTTRLNPESWTESFNVIYLDQPAGTGFSYVDDSENPEAYPERNENSALDFIVAVELFRLAFKDLENAPLYVAGESYAGQYVPIYGAAILDHNVRVSARYRIPLVSIIIGNGWVSPKEQFPALYDISCSEFNAIPPILNKSECAKMAPIAARCEMLAEACATFPDDIICGAIGQYCEPALKAPVVASDHSPWDRTLVCKGPRKDLCYLGLKAITDFFAIPEILGILEVESQTQGKAIPFEIVSSIIEKRYSKTGDMAVSSVPALTRLIEDDNVHVLIYVGTNDWIVNPLGVRRYLDEMRFEKYLEFRAQSRQLLTWKTKEGRSAGTVKRIDGLWHVELAGGGHMVPYDQPHSSLEMLKTWRLAVESKQLRNAGMGMVHVGVELEGNRNDDMRAQSRLGAFFSGNEEL